MIGLDTHLRVILPHLGRPLLAPESAARLIAAVRPLPSALADIVGFECRLGGSACADFAFGTSAAGGGRALLGGRHPQAALPPWLLAQPGWAAIGRFVSAWADPGSLLFRGADNPALEFDLEDPLPGVSRPNFFFELPARRKSPGSTLGPPPLAVLEAGLGALTGQPLRAAHRERLRILLEALPPGGMLAQVGLMLGRPQGVTRICLAGIQTRQVVRFLRRAGWEGSWQALAEGLAVAEPFMDAVWVDLDVGDALGPRLGLECVAPAGPPAPRWGAFLGHLVDHALCLREEREALLAYEGVCRPGAGGAWPRDLVAAGLLAGRRSDTYLRSLNVVKLVVDPTRSLTAKAYLAAKRIPYPRSAPRAAAP